MFAASAKRPLIPTRPAPCSASSRSTPEDQIIPFQQEQVKNMVASMFDSDKTMSPAAKARAKEMVIEAGDKATRKVQKFFEELDLDKMLDDLMIPLYAKSYTESELRD